MQTIGERLEEARKRKGISLREAAEATKIRGDFLASIEENKFDFDLPDIYKRGFLKNYARFLKLDVEKTLTDYNAQQLSNSRLGKKAGAEWFGQMEVKKPEQSETSEPAEETPNSLGHIFAKPGTVKEKPESDEASEKDEENDKTFYLKIGLVFVGTLVLVFIVFGLISAILGSGDNDISESPAAPELRESSSISETLTGGGTEQAVSGNSVTLVASGNVYVLVRQKENDAELYRNTMGAGESVTLEKSGPVDILFTAGEFLTIEHSGERMRPECFRDREDYDPVGLLASWALRLRVRRHGVDRFRSRLVTQRARPHNARHVAAGTRASTVPTFPNAHRPVQWEHLIYLPSPEQNP